MICPGCDQEFTPERKGIKYCCAKCRERVQARRKYSYINEAAKNKRKITGYSRDKNQLKKRKENENFESIKKAYDWLSC